MSLIRAQNIEISKVSHDKLKKRDSGAKSVRIMYDNNAFRVQIDRVRVPFGVSVYPNPKETNSTEPKKYSIEISLGGSDSMEHFREVLDEIDDMNVSYCASNSKAWWGKAMSAEVMKEAENYKSHVKPDTKGENPPRLKLKLPFYDNKPLFKVFNMDKKEVNVATKNAEGNWDIDWGWARSGMEIKVIAECEGLWVINKNIYCTWKAVQIQIMDKGSDIRNFAFIEDEETEPVRPQKAKPVAKPSAEEEEEDEDVEYEEEVVEEDE
jgi:hypothetical protein